MMNRRQFFTGAAAVATARFPILGANDRVQLGIVGLGGRGRDHINYYGELDRDCRIVAVCDVNQAARERAVSMVQKTGGAAPREHLDMREVFASKEVDAVSLPLPNHWHALATIWACQAGKDVYVEKPASHEVWEGLQMVAAARKYQRMVQVGSQSRTTAHKMKAVKLLEEGVIGKVVEARGLCYRRRFSIGVTPPEPVPAGVDWDRFLGPAPMRPFTKNRYVYNWHWFWDTGNGDVGNQGVHEMDVGLWGLGKKEWPQATMSSGGKFAWADDQETPNMLATMFEFPDAMMTFEVRNLPTPPEGGSVPRGVNYTGNLFFGEQGYMVLDPAGYQVYRSMVKLTGDEIRAAGAGAGGQDRFEKTIEGKAEEQRGWETTPHMKNFLEAVKSRDHQKLNADIEIGVRAAVYCHFANISYRVRRRVQLESGNGLKFAGDPEANALLTRNYRAPYVVPKTV